MKKALGILFFITICSFSIKGAHFDTQDRKRENIFHLDESRIKTVKVNTGNQIDGFTIDAKYNPDAEKPCYKKSWYHFNEKRSRLKEYSEKIQLLTRFIQENAPEYLRQFFMPHIENKTFCDLQEDLLLFGNPQDKGFVADSHFFSIMLILVKGIIIFEEKTLQLSE